ncbi:hypothetical protein BV22DRAFT_1039788 [Leucogyrophana mollusca]|uniref:Uncharacterized protein n=1 Tax=Leucogyrophana mollusca TaxID=85980 RepID=A0ACB8B4D5_9AGAM|nr:hypothetical protein BV22DRAFT_1039788 [Leucogyrophana mollusca]
MATPPPGPTILYQPPVSVHLVPPEPRLEQFVPIPGPPSKTIHEMIMFNLDVPDPRRCLSDGVPMHYCLLGQGMKDPYEEQFQYVAQDGRNHINFILTWPGYRDLNTLVRVPIYTPNGLLTRRELAMSIATEYHQFVKACDDGALTPENDEWRVGSDAYSFEHISLSSIWTSDGNLWFASIRVASR